MESCGLIPMARKEFSDHLRSRNFLLITAILLLICTVGLIDGVTDYRKSLNAYNAGQVEMAERLGEDLAFMQDRPSALSVFTAIGTQMSILGAILGIALGFNLITKEKESKSLKLLLSHPIYRDEVINGKALGSAAALLLPLGAVLAVALALLLIVGIVPDLREFGLILAFGLATALMILTYFSVALLMSIIAQNSGTALVYSLIVLIAFTMLVPVATNATVMNTIIGEPPEFPAMPSIDVRDMGTGVGEVGEVRVIDTEGEEWQQFWEARREYEERRSAAHSILCLISPSMNYEATLDLLDRVSGSGADSMDPVSGMVKNVFALVAFPAVFFALAYSRFMRLDIR
ncbi:ABC transporter permease subunit [Methanoculleus bourgensis]|uniref:ABC transporter permease subunit n=1 Tax=Methanoculleus bourgensis TaxID=83986 RepID=UPI0022EEBAA0|nr:ABC transporter permease subunit [Methanoculleus bourgensis]GLI45754.1 hypothetical protein MBOURGENBZM_05460 [Methanoculleus bourgensis]